MGMSDSGFGAPPPPPPPPSAGGGGSIPQRGIGDIISTAFDIYKANATSLITIVAIIVVPLSFIGAFLTGVVFAPDKIESTDIFTGQTIEVTDTNFGLFIAGAIVAALISVVISAVLQAAIMRGAALASVGDPLDVEASYRYGFRRLGSVILISILVGLAVAVGFVFFIIPGVIFLVKFAVSIPALVVEDRRGTDAMSRSWNITKGYFWHVIGVVVVAWIVTAVVGFVIGAIGAIFGDLWLIRWLFSAAAQIITAPFSALVSILLYIDLRARSEALTGETLRTELARTA
jgi:hypothetical protein